MSGYTFLPLAFLWFGAAVSLPEIQTGALLAGAGLNCGIWAILLGHAVGCSLLGLMAYIGCKEKIPAIMCSRIAFGEKGSWLFSVFNVLQLVGWTAVMLQQSSMAANAILERSFNISAPAAITIVMGVAVLIWSLWEVFNKHKGNILAVLLLFVLAIAATCYLWDGGNLLDKICAGGNAENTGVQSISFGLAFELSIIMPLSWLPLIADYTSRAKTVSIACISPVTAYFLGSVWMYLLGFFGTLATGETEPVNMLLAVGMGMTALCIVCLSAITTTFLDVYSAVVSARNISSRFSSQLGCVVVVAIGIVLAIVWSSDLYIRFLLLIGMFFAPFAGIIICDYFIVHNDSRRYIVDFTSLLSLTAGIVLYQLLADYDLPLGNTLICILGTAGIHFFLRKTIGIIYKKDFVKNNNQ